MKMDHYKFILHAAFFGSRNSHLIIYYYFHLICLGICCDIFDVALICNTYQQQIKSSPNKIFRIINDERINEK